MAAQSSDAYQQVPANPDSTAAQVESQNAHLPLKQPTQLRQAPGSQPGQPARLARRAAIRAKRQAERRAEQQLEQRQASLQRAKPNADKSRADKSGVSKPGVSRLTARSTAQLENAAQAGSPALHTFRPKRSLWLTLLAWLQHGSAITTLVLVVGALITYGWTVYVQEQWGKSFAKLESLKKQERQLVSANEVLKNQMAEQAEKPTAGLLLPDPSNAIFLTPAPQRPPVKSKPIVSPESEPIRPLGY